MRTAIICGALMALTLSAANADGAGQYWASKCSKAPEGSAQQTYCRGLVEGVLFGLALEMKGLPGGHAPIICPPSIDDVPSAMRAVNNWAAAHPDMVVASLPVLIEFALIAAYPCSR